MLTTNWQEIGWCYVGNTGYGDVYTRLYAKYSSQNIAGNYTNYELEERLYTSGGTWQTGSVSVNLDGDYQDLGYQYFSAGEETLKSASRVAYHNADGNYSRAVGCDFNSYWFGGKTATGSFSLPTIPRYANASISLNSTTETTAKINWSSDSTIDGIWVSVNGGGWQGGYGIASPITISGLNPNSTYSIKMRVKRQDSQLYSETNTIQATTYNVPYVNSINDFTIGNNCNFTLYNPLRRSVQCKLKVGDNIIATRSTTGTTGLLFELSQAEIELLYNTIPNATSGQFRILAVCSALGSSQNSTQKTFSVNVDECKPTFNDFSYQDIDNDIVLLTANNQLLVNNYSNCNFTISTENKAIAKNGASITKYKCEWGSKSSEVLFSNDTLVEKNVEKSSGSIIKVTAIDSRGLSTSISKSIDNVLYVNAVVNEVETQRKNGILSETYLKARLTLWNGNWENNNSNPNYNNRLNYVGYRVYIDDQWSEYYDITTIFKESMHSYDSSGSLVIYVDYSDEIAIHSNGTSGGFAVGSSFKIQLLIKDGTNTNVFSPTEYQAILQGEVTNGKVGLARYKDYNGDYHYGINGMPSDDYTENVHGTINIRDKIYLGGELFAWVEEK